MAAATKQAALVGAGVAVIILSAKLLRHAAAKILRSFDKYDGLDGVVSFSSRKIAGLFTLHALLSLSANSGDPDR